MRTAKVVIATVPTKRENLAAQTDEELQQITSLDRNERLAIPGFTSKWD